MSRATVWHDGGCPLCRREIAPLAALERLYRGSLHVRPRLRHWLGRSGART